MVLCCLLAIGACDSAGTTVAPVVTCNSTMSSVPMDTFLAQDVGVYLESGGDAGLEIVRGDVAKYLGQMWGLPAVTVGTAQPDFSKPLTVWFSTTATARATAYSAINDGYTIRRVDSGAGTVIIVYAPDAHDLAFGAYAFLEELGARFFHPKQEFVPAFGQPTVPHDLNISRAPAMASRGLQVHTLHPIEYFKVFNEPGAANFADAQLFVDWLVKTGQNYFQWVQLSTVDFATWKPYATSIIEYAHSRGVSVGSNVQMWAGSSLQNNYVLVTDEASWEEEMDAQLDQLLSLPWDTLELAMGEFTSADPQSVIDWLNHAVAHSLAVSPQIEINVQNHVGNYPDLYVQYMGQTVFYYHLPQYADVRLGQSVHTLFFFDVYRDWATYAHPNFFLQHDYMMQELPTRRVKYFPESAYWISADIDVPLFLPEYLYARWLDINSLTTETAQRGLPPMDGHLTFTSGHEWNYWLTDYLTAKMLWEPQQPLDYFLAHYAAAFGNCSSDIQTALSSFIDLQTQYLFNQRLVAYVQGENVDVELGYLAGLETHPRRVEFETVLAMNDGDRATFQTDVVDALESMAGDILPIENAVAARCRGSDAATAPWCNELWDGISIVRLRAEHAAHLYRAILDKAAGTDGTAEYNAALGVTTEAAAVIARREAHYRFDLSRMVDDYTNPTVYQFGYLRPAHTQCYYRRREQQVTALLQTGVAAGVLALPSCQN